MKRTILVSLALAGIICQAQVETYPGPEGIIPSDKYKAAVIQKGKVYESFTYKTTSNFHLDKRGTTASWTNFSFSGPVVVEVTRLDGPVSSCVIRPERLNIKPVIIGNKVQFKLKEPCKISVEFDGNIIHSMLVFADAPEKDIPDPDDPGVIYFKPGVHLMGKEKVLKTNDHVYIAGGAYVYGSFIVEGDNVKIHGRGILSAARWPKYNPDSIAPINWQKAKIPENQFNMVEVLNVQNCFCEGITFVDHPMYVMRGGFYTHIENIKSIGWLYNCDGLTCNDNGTIKDCFLRVNDDALKLYHNNMVVENITIWQYMNGSPFQWNWHNLETKNVRVKNCDVIHVEYLSSEGNNKAIFNSARKSGGIQTDYIFENIYIEDPGIARLFKFNQTGDGEISNTLFKNLYINGLVKNVSILEGNVNLTFDGLYMDGKRVKDYHEAGFADADVKKISIK